MKLYEKALLAIIRGLFLLPVAGIVVLLLVPVGVAIGDRPRDSPEVVNEELPAVEYITVEAPKSNLVVSPSGNVYTDEVPMAERYQCVMQEACRQYDVPYSLALGIAEVESSWDFEAYSGYAWGLMQINPVNYDWLRDEGIDPESYIGNIEAGVYMIGDLLDRYGDTDMALMAYNCGEYGASQLWDEGYTSSEYSRKVVTAAAKWAAIIGE